MISKDRKGAQKNYDGMRFGNHIVIRRDHKDEKNRWWFLCKCDCGREYLTRGTSALKDGGCICRRPRYKHGKTNTRLFKLWKSMKNRCYCEKWDGYKNYGGKGIKVCPEWKENFMNFYEWAYSSGYDENKPAYQCTLDRIDGNKDYEPSNCRWVTQKEQVNNINRNRIIEYKGEKRTLAEWADRLDINYQTIYSRLSRGWSVDRAFYAKPKKGKGWKREGTILNEKNIET